MFKSLFSRRFATIAVPIVTSVSFYGNNSEASASIDKVENLKVGKPTKTKTLESNQVILSGTANLALSQQIADLLHTELLDVTTRRFSDGELNCVINESIRGKDIIIVQTCAAPVNDNIMELLLTVAAARRAGANTVTAVIPYFGYKYHRRGLPISTTYSSRFLWSAAADLAKMLQCVGVDSVVSVDLQRPGQGHEACFFDSNIPVETISTSQAFAEYFKNNIEPPLKKVVIVSANTECVKKARKFQRKLKEVTGLEDVEYAVFMRGKKKI
jgi:ribose-phosphate pyrophosphokinase